MHKSYHNLILITFYYESISHLYRSLRSEIMRLIYERVWSY